MLMLPRPLRIARTLPTAALRWRASDPLPLGAVQARADAALIARYFDRTGLLQTVTGNSQLRSAHFPFPGAPQCVLLEAAITNPLASLRDLTNAAWVKVGVPTVAKDQTGIDGAANAASSVLANAPNTTVLQTLVAGSTSYVYSAFIRRLIGVGGLDMTVDAGVTWTPVIVPSGAGPYNGYWRVNGARQSLANPSIGFRVQTSGDKIAVDWNQADQGTNFLYPFSPIAAAAVRAADQLKLALPWSTPRPFTWLVDYIEQGAISTTDGTTGPGALGSAAVTAVAMGFLVVANTPQYRWRSKGTGDSIINGRQNTIAQFDRIQVALSVDERGRSQVEMARNFAQPTIDRSATTQGFGATFNTNFLFLGINGGAQGGMVSIHGTALFEGYTPLSRALAALERP